MNGERPASVIVGGILFLLIFGGLTVAALATAELNLATILIGAVSVFVCVAVVVALIGVMRDPPGQ